MKKSSLIIVLIALGLVHVNSKLFAQTLPNNYRIMFYNVENLFDTEDDPNSIDEEFLPKGDRYWTDKKFYLKLNRIYQVVMAAGQGQLPVLLGCCEIENQQVLDLLLYKTPLGKLGYKIIHQESPDRRGIDVALLYRKDVFIPISFNAIPVINPNDKDFKTRDILYTKGTIGNDTLDVFVNHWPSKFGGVVETKSLRALAAQTLKTATDSLFSYNPLSKIVIMGDFNDSPFDESIARHLNALDISDTIENNALYDLAYPLAKENLGTNKYQGKWELIDQMIVSGALLQTNKGLSTAAALFQIFDAPFLLEEDKNYLGKKPFRTYQGFKYNNGFSDHLPVLLDLRAGTN